jgi:hypothetical protein
VIIAIWIWLSVASFVHVYRQRTLGIFSLAEPDHRDTEEWMRLLSQKDKVIELVRKSRNGDDGRRIRTVYLRVQVICGQNSHEGCTLLVCLPLVGQPIATDFAYGPCLLNKSRMYDFGPIPGSKMAWATPEIGAFGLIWDLLRTLWRLFQRPGPVWGVSLARTKLCLVPAGC